MEGSRGLNQGQWLAQSQSSSYRSWSGYAFENVCIRHIDRIREVLGISGMVTYQASWRKAGNAQGPGAQIDLLIDRSDQCINVCEIKFSEQLFTIDKSYAEALQRKIGRASCRARVCQYV